MTIAQALADGLFTPGQFEVVSAYGSVDDLGSDTVAALGSLASRALLLKSVDGGIQVAPSPRAPGVL